MTIIGSIVKSKPTTEKMHKPNRHRILANEIQLVLALDGAMEPATDAELRTIRDLILSALRPTGLTVTACVVTNRYVDARATFEDRIHLANVMRNAKGTVAKQFSVLFPGRESLFAQGYMARTVGDPMPPDEAVRLIVGSGES